MHNCNQPVQNLADGRWAAQTRAVLWGRLPGAVVHFLMWNTQCPSFALSWSKSPSPSSEMTHALICFQITALPVNNFRSQVQSFFCSYINIMVTHFLMRCQMYIFQNHWFNPAIYKDPYWIPGWKSRMLAYKREWVYFKLVAGISDHKHTCKCLLGLSCYWVLTAGRLMLIFFWAHSIWNRVTTQFSIVPVSADAVVSLLRLLAHYATFYDPDLHTNPASDRFFSCKWKGREHPCSFSPCIEHGQVTGLIDPTCFLWA